MSGPSRAPRLFPGFGTATLLLLSACGGTGSPDADTTSDSASEAAAQEGGADSAAEASADAPPADAPGTDAPPPDGPSLDAPAPDAGGPDAPASDVPVMDAPPAMDAAPDAPAADVPAADVPAADVPPVDAPAGSGRLLRPLSTMRVVMPRPRLRWANALGTTGGRVDLCRDRAMTTGCVALAPAANAVQPASNLATGWWYWRVHFQNGGVDTGAVSPVWQFWVRAANTTVSPQDNALGTRLELNGDTYAEAAIAAPGGTARVNVYQGGPSGFGPTPAVLTTPGGTTAVPVAAGDVNGDGFGDLLILWSTTSATVHFGGAAGVAMAPSQRLTLNLRAVGTGMALGDVDGDGFGDVVVSDTTAGALHLLLGSAMGLRVASATPALTLPASMVAAGASLSAGDVDGDGSPELVVGAPGSNMITGMNTGSAALVRMPGPAGWTQTPVTLPPGAPLNFGWTVSLEGDHNGDGFADLVVSAPGTLASGGPPLAGTIYLWPGSVRGLGALTSTITASIPLSEYGLAMSTGDFDGDGYDDVSTGTRASANALVFRGGNAGLTMTSPYTLGAASGIFVSSGACPGDVNNDGREDLVMGEPIYSMNAGRAYLFLGTNVMGGMVSPASTLTGTAGSNFGTSVALRLPRALWGG